MTEVQPAGCQTMVDPAAADAGSEELLAADHPPLPSGDPRRLGLAARAADLFRAPNRERQRRIRGSTSSSMADPRRRRAGGRFRALTRFGRAHCRSFDPPARSASRNAEIGTHLVQLRHKRVTKARGAAANRLR
jgi:hypothetical protein